MGIRIEDLCIAYAQQRVIDGLSLTIEPGSFFTLLGPSGCGKTTLLRAIAGFVPVQSGRMSFGNEDVTRLAPHERNIGMVFQDYALFPNRSVFENVAYGLRARRTAEATIRQKVPAALERVGLGHLGERLPAALSGGQRQRVALARALVIQPRVLLMDEPLSNLDAKLRVQVRQTIAELQREAAITTVFVTHDQEEALALADRIAVMHKGRIAQLGTPREVYETPASGYVADFVGAANLLPVRGTGFDGQRAVLALGAVALQAPSTTDWSGRDAVLVARPEHIALEPPGAGLVPGRVRSFQYLGVKTSYRVALTGAMGAAGAERIVNVDLPSHGHRPFAAGAEVGLRFDAERSRVVAPAAA